MNVRKKAKGDKRSYQFCELRGSCCDNLDVAYILLIKGFIFLSVCTKRLGKGKERKERERERERESWKVTIRKVASSTDG